MKPSTVNYLNIGLMAGSLVFAFVLPFHLFLFSYAVLGPLHYLTEISWLRDRGFFSLRKIDWLPLTLLTVPVILAHSVVMPEGKDVEWLRMWVPEVTFIACVAALAFVLSRSWSVRAAWIVAAAFIGLILHRDGPVDASSAGFYVSVFGMYLTSLIHVSVFTGAFILWGALKSKSTSGLVSFFVFVACYVVLFSTRAEAATSDLAAGDDLAKGYFDSFGGLHILAYTQFSAGRPLESLEQVFGAPYSVQIARLFAFAWTYHFLNWFSKTSVIRWHEIPRARFAVVILLWIASVVLYFTDYIVGFRWLFALSLVHVFLEFPLNHLSFLGIGRELRARLT